MSNYNIAKIYPNDRFANTQIEKLLQEEGIRRDPNLDYTCGDRKSTRLNSSH